MVAKRLYDTLRGKWDLDDLYQDAVIGLIDATKRFDRDIGSFTTYAYVRSKGYVLDQVRAQTWRPRLDTVRIQKFLRAANAVCAEGGYDLPAIQREIGCDDMEFDRILTAYEDRMMMLSGWAEDRDPDEMKVPPESQGEVDTRFDQLEVKELVEAAIERLKSPQQRQAVRLSLQGLNMRETGKMMKLTESRVCQIWKKLREVLPLHVEVLMRGQAGHVFDERDPKPASYRRPHPPKAFQGISQEEFEALRDCDKHVVINCLEYLANPGARLGRPVPTPDPEMIRRGNEHVIRMCEEHLKNGAAGRS